MRIMRSACRPGPPRHMARRRQLTVGFNDGRGDSVLQLLVVSQGGVELALSFTLFILQFQHGTVMGVRSGDERVFDPCLLPNAPPNALEPVFRRCAAKVQADALTEVKAGLALGVVKGVITPAEETRLVNDAQDAISVLMAAKLSALLPAGH